jgi:hypothetical protein
MTRSSRLPSGVGGGEFSGARGSFVDPCDPAESGA